MSHATQCQAATCKGIYFINRCGVYVYVNVCLTWLRVQCSVFTLDAAGCARHTHIVCVLCRILLCVSSCALGRHPFILFHHFSGIGRNRQPAAAAAGESCFSYLLMIPINILALWNRLKKALTQV